MRRSAILACALLAAACRTAGPVPAPPSPAAAAADPRQELRALLLLLVDRQTWEPFSVEQALAGGAELRRELAVALGRVGDGRALPALAGLAVDETVAVRRAAVFALGQIGEPSAAGTLQRALRDPDRETGALAIEALAKLGIDLEAVWVAGESLPPEELEARLLPALWRFTSPLVVPLAQQGLLRPEADLRRRAAYALAREPVAEGAPLLRGLLADPDPWVRGWAARALGRIGDGGDLQLLRPLLDDPEPGPVIRALGAARELIAAGRAAPPGGWRPRLLELLDGGHRGVRLAALAAAGAWLLDAALGDRLVEIAGGEAAAERRAAIAALAIGGEPRAVRQAFAAAASAESGDRAAAAAAAAELGEWGRLERLAGDGEAAVRQAALAAELGASPAAAAAARAALADADPGVRALALHWLAGSPVEPVVGLLRALEGERWAGELPELPLNGIRALVARAHAEPAEVDAAAFALERYAAGGSHLLRRAAADGLEELGRSRPPIGTVEIRRRVADYAEILRRTRQPRLLRLSTAHGDLRLRLDCPQAPLTCLNFLQLARQGFYDGLTFHRVVPDFVVQGGDPRGDGWGGPGYTIRDEVNRLRFAAGTIGMALGGPDTGGSQFFITLSAQPHLDDAFTAFGRVVGGWGVLERIAPGDRILSVSEVEADAGPLS